MTSYISDVTFSDRNIVTENADSDKDKVRDVFSKSIKTEVLFTKREANDASKCYVSTEIVVY